MPVTGHTVKDAANVTQSVAVRRTGGLDYQMDGPEVLVSRIISAGSGDATLISAVACVVRAVRVWNGGAVACHAKLHNLAVAPTVGVTPVTYSASAQAGAGNYDQRLASGGLNCSTGLGVTITTGIANNDTTGVVAASVIVEVEYHLD